MSQHFQAKDPKFREKCIEVFEKAPFVSHLGIKLVDIWPGWCETYLAIKTHHLQQNKVIHAGVQATLADHTAGAASGSLVKEGTTILTAEYKINLLRPAKGELLTCRADVLKAGQQLIVTESQVFAQNQGKTTLVAKAIFTMAVVSEF